MKSSLNLVVLGYALAAPILMLASIFDIELPRQFDALNLMISYVAFFTGLIVARDYWHHTEEPDAHPEHSHARHHAPPLRTFHHG